MKSIPVILFLLLTILLHFNVRADKTFKFSYDENGNRTFLTFISTCRLKKPNDTIRTKEDTTVLVDSIDVNTKRNPLITGPKVYPTLVHDYCTIFFPNEIQNGTLQLINMSGEIIFTETNINTSTIIVKTCDIPNGMYYLIFYDLDRKIITQKIIKQ